MTELYSHMLQGSVQVVIIAITLVVIMGVKLKYLLF